LADEKQFDARSKYGTISGAWIPRSSDARRSPPVTQVEAVKTTLRTVAAA
jgi:hypothetical protein